ncbi:MAG: hypothetical protein IKG58_02710 [Bacilli bacterium]|nr:hypothetical protein [Bacilli bacterium]
MNKKIKEAVKSADSSNKIEENPLKKEEFKEIVEYIKNNKSDESFLYSLIQKIKEEEKNREEVDKDVKTR